MHHLFNFRTCSEAPPRTRPGSIILCPATWSTAAWTRSGTRTPPSNPRRWRTARLSSRGRRRPSWLSGNSSRRRFSRCVAVYIDPLELRMENVFTNIPVVQILAVEFLKKKSIYLDTHSKCRGIMLHLKYKLQHTFILFIIYATPMRLELDF